MLFYISRYTLFIGLYPLGVTGEILCVYAALPAAAEKKIYSVSMPNALNFAFDFYYGLIVFVLLYFPGKYFLFIFMIANTSKCFIL